MVEALEAYHYSQVGVIEFLVVQLSVDIDP